MREWQSLSHVRWYCRYHVVFVPKYRKRAIFGHLRRQIGSILRELCVQHEIELIEGHAMPDHVHLLLSIPPKFSVANTVGFVKGKSAIRIHRQFLGVERNFRGDHFWARGYCVSTVASPNHTGGRSGDRIPWVRTHIPTSIWVAGACHPANTNGRVVSSPVLGGLHHAYRRAP